jgi:hypothetical protein
MIGLTFAIATMFFSIGFIVLSKSEKNYNALIESNGEVFAQKVTKTLNIGGKCLLVFSILWVVFLLAVD